MRKPKQTEKLFASEMEHVRKINNMCDTKLMHIGSV